MEIYARYPGSGTPWLLAGGDTALKQPDATITCAASVLDDDSELLTAVLAA